MPHVKALVVGKEYELEHYLEGVPTTEHKTQDGSGPTEISIGPYSSPGEIILAERLLSAVYGNGTLFNYYREGTREQKGNHYHVSQGAHTTVVEYYAEGLMSFLMPSLCCYDRRHRFRNSVTHWAYLGLVPFQMWDELDEEHPYLYVCVNRRRGKHTTENRLTEARVVQDILRTALGILFMSALDAGGAPLWDMGEYGAGWAVPAAQQMYVLGNPDVRILPLPFLDAANALGWLTEDGKELYKEAQKRQRNTAIGVGWQAVKVTTAVVYSSSALVVGASPILDQSVVLPALDEQVSKLPREWRPAAAYALLWLAGVGALRGVLDMVQRVEVALVSKQDAARVARDVSRLVFGGVDHTLAVMGRFLDELSDYYRYAAQGSIASLVHRSISILGKVSVDSVREGLTRAAGGVLDVVG